MISPHLDIFAVFIFLGVIQAVFLATLCLFGKPCQEPSNRFLAILLLTSAATLLEIFLCYSGYITRLLHYYDASEPFNFVSGPLLFAYIYTYIHQKKPARWLLHFIPFLLYALYSCFFFIQSATYKYNAFLDAYHPDIVPVATQVIFTEDPLGIKNHINLLSVIFNGIYYYLLIRLLQKHVQQQESISFWQIPQVDLRWIRNIFLLSVIGYLLWVYRTFFVFRDLQDYAGAALGAAIIYYVSFVMLQFPEIFKFQNPDLSGKRADKKQTKYAKSNLNDADKEMIMEQLTRLMEQEKVYRDNLVSLTHLSKKLAIPTHSISQVLNEKLQKNFFGFLAYYRVEEAKQLLSDATQHHLTIEEIAGKVGYNSKSAFNNAFKKLTNNTPSGYRKKNS